MKWRVDWHRNMLQYKNFKKAVINDIKVLEYIYFWGGLQECRPHFTKFYLWVMDILTIGSDVTL